MLLLDSIFQFIKNVIPIKIQKIMIINNPGIVFQACIIVPPLMSTLVRSALNQRPSNNEAIKTAQHLRINITKAPPFLE
ncbi:MAG TPA: hypothetical protein DD405_08015 [Desulfobacteraceae bacterium]|nr:hypothetical protein [Desulfobacteraceae bacterium]